MNIWNQFFKLPDRALVEEYRHMNYFKNIGYNWNETEIKRRYFQSKIYIQ